MTNSSNAAIVYSSNSGFTRQYAEMLAEKTGLACYALDEAAAHLNDGARIIYMGWLRAGSIVGYNRAAKRYAMSAVCTVGMGPTSGNQGEEAAKRYKLARNSVFYLQGGLDMSKLHGLNKFAMRLVRGMLCKQLEKKADTTEEERAMLDVVKNGGSFVSSDNLNDIIEFIKER